MLVFGVVGHNFSGQLRNIMACIALTGDVHFTVLIAWESFKPSNQEHQ